MVSEGWLSHSIVTLAGRVLSILVDSGVALSILSCVLIDVTILFLDMCFAVFRLLPMICLLMVHVLACLSLAVSGACGPAFTLPL